MKIPSRIFPNNPYIHKSNIPSQNLNLFIPLPLSTTTANFVRFVYYLQNGVKLSSAKVQGEVSQRPLNPSPTPHPNNRRYFNELSRPIGGVVPAIKRYFTTKLELFAETKSSNRTKPECNKPGFGRLRRYVIIKSETSSFASTNTGAFQRL